MTDPGQPSALKPGAIGTALLSAALFGASTPLAKLLLLRMDPQLVAGLLYLGAGLGLFAIHVVQAALRHSAAEAPLRRPDLPWLAAIVMAGGVLGPLLLMLGLARTSAATASLLLNVEGLATMGIAWVVFRESVDRRLLVGAFAILAGAAVLSWRGAGSWQSGAVLIVAACVCWAVDNNLTRKLSAADPVQIAMLKGLAAGTVNLGLAAFRGVALPELVLTACVIGFFGYGLSLVLFVLAMRSLGVARTGAYFSLAPFVGSALAIPLLGDTVSPQLVVAGGLMGAGLWLHLSERHEHEHTHAAMEHEHRHSHDEHHRHDHGDALAIQPHTHRHLHAPLVHRHRHLPDLHHRHRHGPRAH